MKRACILAAVAAIGSLTFVSVASAEVRAGKNYRLNTEGGPAGKDQLAMASNPANRQHVVAVMCEYLTQTVEGRRSLDGGRTWSGPDTLETPASTPPYAPSCRIGNHLADQVYQTVAFGSGNNVYATFSTPKTTLAGGEEGSTVFVSKSTDGGLTWAPGVIALEGGTSPTLGPYYELPTIEVHAGAGPGGADRVYVSAHEVTAAGEPAGDAHFARSSDSGATFAGPVQIEPAGENVGGPEGTSEPVVLEDGDILVAWRLAGANGAIRVARSEDQGATWGAPVTVTNVTAGGNTSNTNPPVPQQSTGSTFPRLAVDRSASPDRVYVVYNQGTPPGPTPPPGGYAPSDHFIHHDTDVYFQRSVDAGATWQAPKLINDTTQFPGNDSPGFGPVTQTRHPNVAVAPNGRIDITWEDRRHWYRGCIHTHVICDEARLGDSYYAYSTNGGVQFSDDQRISDKHHNNDVGYDYRFGTGWTFGPEPVATGDNTLLVGWMDSREGGFDTDRQDIYLSQVNHTGPATPAQETLATPSALSAMSIALSQHTYQGGGEGLLASTFATRNGTKVVIVNENDYPAILAAGVLARANLSHVLLSPAGGLSAEVRAEVQRMQPAGAYVIGDTAALSSQVVTDLQAAGVPNDAGQIERLGSANDAETARDIAAELDRRTQAQRDANAPAFHSVAVVNPASPDAAAVAGLAAHRRLPILFSDPSPSANTMPEATTQAIAAQDINDALVIGGPQWINDTAAGTLPSAERLGGANQYETSQQVVAESRERGVPENIAYVANGAAPTQAALLGSTVGRVGALLQLVPAPLGTSATSAASAAGISGVLDRQILVQPAQAQPPPPQQQGPPTVINGTPGNDVINGTAANEVINGGGGNDTINGGGGNDTINGGAGNDTINGGAGNDRIDGGAGNDRIDGGAGDDTINGGAGNDNIDGGSGDDTVDGNSGNDLISGGGSATVARASQAGVSSGDDRLIGSSGRDTINGRAGNDRISGGSGSDRLLGSAGRDRITGTGGSDRIHGGSGGDRLSGNSGNDRIAGSSGSDRIAGDSGSDRLAGNSGNDRVKGGSGRDRISGGSGRDRLDARDGSLDRVNCGSSRDRVAARSNDRVSGNCESVSR